MFISILGIRIYGPGAFLLDRLWRRGLRAAFLRDQQLACGDGHHGNADDRVAETGSHDNERAFLMSCSARPGLYIDDRAFLGSDSVRFSSSLRADAWDGSAWISPHCRSLVLKRTLLKAPPPPFIMEMRPIVGRLCGRFENVVDDRAVR